MATKSHGLRDQLYSPFNAESRHRIFEKLSRKYPVLDWLIASLAAIPGLLLVVLFPLASLVLLLTLPGQFYTLSSFTDWTMLFVHLLALGLSITMSYFQITTAIKQPNGYDLDYEMAPVLFDLVSQYEALYEKAVIDRIVLQNDSYIRVIKTPRLGQPFITTNTLIIGLPLLLSLPEKHFKVLLARRIGQASRKHSLISGFLSQLRQIFRSYRNTYSRSKNLPLRLYHVFFKAYIPVYDRLSFFIARRDELEADRYALEQFNDDDFRETLSQEIITLQFLDKVYWPKIMQLFKRDPNKPYLPYRHMSQVASKGIRNEDVRSWIMQAINEITNYRHYQPPLIMRLDNIGHNKPGSPVALSSPAADTLLDSAVKEVIIGDFDQRWLKRNIKKFK